MIGKYKYGMTFSELLLVLVVTGIIFSYTIPDLIQNIQDAHLKVAWKGAFSTLSSASRRANLDSGGDFRGYIVTPNDNDFRDLFLSYLNPVKTCNSGTSGCWHTPGTSKYLYGDPITASFTTTSKAILNNGILIRFSAATPDCTSYYSPNSDSCGRIVVDVNGFKGPNTVGKDIFGVNVTRWGRILPFGTQNDYYYNDAEAYSCDLVNNSGTEGWSCSAEHLKQ